jgi:alpha-galactosidase
LKNNDSITMPRITLIGAGSTVFAKRLIGDILLTPELKGEVEVMLHDIDTDRLKTSEIVTRRLAKSLNLDISIQASTDRRAMLREADYVILMMQVGGFRPATVTDFEIPKKYGLRQTIADTLGIGGIMRGLRTIPVLEEILQEMEDLCPDATLLNYVNPMGMLCMAINRIAPERKMVGLCHSVQGTAEELAKDLGEELKEINYFCAGINHMSFYLRFEKVQKGEREDLYPRLMEIAQSERMPKENRVRYEMLKRLGYFVTESSEHFAEYTPWFIKRDRPDLIEGFNIPLDEYITRCENQISEWDQLRRDLEDESVKLDVCQSHEYAASIINAMETGVSSIINGNVPNQDIISNLPSDISVEVPCQIDRNGIQPLHVGNLPPQLAALIMTNVNVQQLTVEAAMTGKREYIYHAAMMDPHTAAELSIDEIWKLVDELIEAHGAMLPKFH